MENSLQVVYCCVNSFWVGVSIHLIICHVTFPRVDVYHVKKLSTPHNFGLRIWKGILWKKIEKQDFYMFIEENVVPS